MAGRTAAGAGRRLVLPVSVGAIGLALIGVGQIGPNRLAIEDDLTSRSSEALKSADLVGLSVSFSGRDATITGADNPELANQAEDVVSTVNGVRVAKAHLTGTGTSSTDTSAPAETPTETAAPVETSTPAESPAETPSATPTPTAKPLILPVGFTLVDGTITVTGTVGSTTAGTALINAVKTAENGWIVVDKLLVDASVTAQEPAPNRLAALTKLLSTAPISGAKLVIQYNHGSVILRGTPADAGAERALLTAAAATVAGKSAVMDGLDTP